MQTVESLKRNIRTAEDLQSVVRTMKSLAAVNIRQYETAVRSLAEYQRTIELGLQVVLHKNPHIAVTSRPAPKQRLGAIVFGSDQGMCGQLNDQIVNHAQSELQRIGVDRADRVLLAVGYRAETRLIDIGEPVEDVLSVPASMSAAIATVHDLVVRLDHWHVQQGIDTMLLFYCKHGSGSSYRPHTVHLLPLDTAWLSRMQEAPWPTRNLPTFSMNADVLFSDLVREYLFVSVCRAFAESSASENASRLASMQAAERNIDDRISELVAEYHRQRQMAITEELLDIVSGWEALAGDAKKH